MKREKVIDKSNAFFSIINRTGSDHIREKDGIWASLAFLSVLATKKTGVKDLLEGHWKEFGRNYFLRLDYENVDGNKANKMITDLENKLKTTNLDVLSAELAAHAKGSGVAEAPEKYKIAFTDNFEYTDSVDGSVAKGQGLRLVLENGGRLVWRLSGTGSSGATVRVYLEKCDNENVNGVALVSFSISCFMLCYVLNAILKRLLNV